MIGVTVLGVPEVVTQLGVVKAAASELLEAELLQLGEKVAERGREKISRYQGASLDTIVAQLDQDTVRVVQTAAKVTGRRGDYGALQQVRLDEALNESTADAEAAILEVAAKLVAVF